MDLQCEEECFQHGHTQEGLAHFLGILQVQGVNYFDMFVPIT